MSQSIGFICLRWHGYLARFELSSHLMKTFFYTMPRSSESFFVDAKKESSVFR